MIKKMIFIIFWLLILYCIIALGFWQLDRAKQKRHILAEFNTMAVSEIVNWQGENNLPHRQNIKIMGKYGNKHFLLDNKYQQGVLGYDVISPFYTDYGIIMVNRGWIKRSLNRKDLPEIFPIPEEIELLGYVYRNLANQILLGPNQDNPNQWPRIIQRVDLAQMRLEFESQLADFVVRLQADAIGAYITNWPVVNMSVQKHIAYAIQWFIMAIVLIILLIIWGWKSFAK